MKKTDKNPSVVCSDSGVKYTDLSYTEVRNEQFVCGSCGTRLLIPKTDEGKLKLENGREVVVPRHETPGNVNQYRKFLDSLSNRSE